MRKILVFLTLAFASSSVSAQAQPQSQPVKADPKESGVDRIVCKREDEIGSRLKAKKVCMTNAEWAQFEAQHRQDVNDMQRQANTRPSADPG